MHPQEVVSGAGSSVLGLAAAVFIGASQAAADTDLTLQPSQVGGEPRARPSALLHTGPVQAAG